MELWVAWSLVGLHLPCGISLGSTPPSGCMVRSCLSASGLQALTQSPLLFQGRTPSSHSKDTRGNLPVTGPRCSPGLSAPVSDLQSSLGSADCGWEGDFDRAVSCALPREASW